MFTHFIAAGFNIFLVDKSSDLTNSTNIQIVTKVTNEEEDEDVFGNAQIILCTIVE